MKELYKNLGVRRPVTCRHKIILLKRKLKTWNHFH